MLSSAATRYLLAIYELSDNGMAVRSVDIANMLKVSRASVVKSLKRLVQEGLVNKEHYGNVQLTPTGVREANRIYTEYTLLHAFFTHCLQVGPSAQADAVSCLCGLSGESKNRLIELALRQAERPLVRDAAGM